jgi:hypothetical protein
MKIIKENGIYKNKIILHSKYYKEYIQ